MAIQRQYWLLGGGLGLAASLWLMEGLAQTLVQVGELTLTGSAVLLGLWWLYQRSAQAKTATKPLPPLDRTQVEQTLRAVQTDLDRLSQELPDDRPAQETPTAQTLAAQHIQLQTAKNALVIDLDRSHLRLALIGGAGVGKTTLLEALKTWWPSPTALETAEINAELTDSVDWTQFDAVLWVTTGDLTEGDRQRLQHLTHLPRPLSSNQPPLQAPALIVALNKLDQYSPGHQATLLTQLCQRLQGLVPSQNIVPLSAAPAPIQVRRQQPDGSWHISQEQPQPALTPLLDTIAPYQDPATRQTLLYNTTYRQAIALQRSAHTALNQIRREQALPVIEHYQWIAGGAALVNPVPSLDLLAAVAINGQLVLEISRIYQKPLSLEQGQELAATLGELVVKLGLVEVSTQALATAFKANGLTFWAGAGLQGVSAAYLTRMAGLSLVEYFANLDPAAEASPNAIVAQLQPLLQKAFSAQGQRERLQAFGQQAIAHLKGQTPQSQTQTPASA